MISRKSSNLLAAGHRFDSSQEQVRYERTSEPTDLLLQFSSLRVSVDDAMSKSSSSTWKWSSISEQNGTTKPTIMTFRTETDWLGLLPEQQSLQTSEPGRDPWTPNSSTAISIALLNSTIMRLTNLGEIVHWQGTNLSRWPQYFQSHQDTATSGTRSMADVTFGHLDVQTSFATLETVLFRYCALFRDLRPARLDNSGSCNACWRCWLSLLLPAPVLCDRTICPNIWATQGPPLFRHSGGCGLVSPTS